MQLGDWFIYIWCRDETSQLVTEGPNGEKTEKDLRKAFEKIKAKDQKEGLGIKFMDLCQAR